MAPGQPDISLRNKLLQRRLPNRRVDGALNFDLGKGITRSELLSDRALLTPNEVATLAGTSKRPTARWHLDEMAVTIAAGGSGCGARSTTKARFSTCSCNDGATRLQSRN